MKKLDNDEKNFQNKARTNKELNPHMAPGQNPMQVTLVGGVTTLTTVPSLLPSDTDHSRCSLKFSVYTCFFSAQADMQPESSGCNEVKYNLNVDTIEAIFKTYPAGEEICNF